MFEAIVIVVVIICIMYFFKDEVFGKNVVVTIVESLPLSIFKKNNMNKEETSIKENTIINHKDEKSNNELEKNIPTDNKVEVCTEDKSIEVEEQENDLEQVISHINSEENEEQVEAEQELLHTIIEENGDIVYWTPNGKTYHKSNTCRTLARSKIINSGSIIESGKDFQCEHCK